MSFSFVLFSFFSVKRSFCTFVFGLGGLYCLFRVDANVCTKFGAFWECFRLL